MKCTGKPQKSGRIEKVNMEESAEEESEVEKHEDEIGIETKSGDEEDMVKNKEGKKCIKRRWRGAKKVTKGKMEKEGHKNHQSSPSMELRLQKGSIKATRQKVNDILGKPMGNRKLQDLDKRHDNDHFIAKWEAQYNHLGKPTPRAIALQMSGTTKADFMFKINFLTLFESTMGTLENGERVPKKPVIRSWNTQMMRKRIMMETSKGCLGNLEHHEDFDPDEDQNGIDLYKGLDVYIKPLSERKPVQRRSFMRRSLRNLPKFQKKDEYSESESDIDNNNKKNDDEEERIVDAKKQKEKEKRNDSSKGTKEAGSEQKDDEEDMKEKEADKQKVYDRNENEKDKQDEHNHLTQDEFWNKEYDLTDSQCEQLKYQATQDIKKKKKTKRKSPEDMTPSTFSFVLTLKESEPTQKEKEKHVEKREKGEEFEFVFEPKDGAATIRDYLQTLALQLKVEFNVIDTFSLVLNHEQKVNTKGKKPSTFSTTMIKKANGKYDDEKQFEAFSKTLKSEFKKDPEIKNMKDLEM
nr:hypothetical protein [Tanacetum cinerariifolium]